MKRTNRHPIAHVILIILVVIILFPVFWVVVTSVRMDEAAFSNKIVTTRLTLQHYRDLLVPEKNVPALILELQNLITFSKPFDTVKKSKAQKMAVRDVERLHEYMRVSSNILTKLDRIKGEINGYLEGSAEVIVEESIRALEDIRGAFVKVAGELPELDPAFAPVVFWELLSSRCFSQYDPFFMTLLERYAEYDRNFMLEFRRFVEGESSVVELRKVYSDVSKLLMSIYDRYIGISRKKLEELKEKIRQLDDEIAKLDNKRHTISLKLLKIQELIEDLYIPEVKVMEDTLGKFLSLLEKGEKVQKNVINTFATEILLRDAEDAVRSMEAFPNLRTDQSIMKMLLGELNVVKNRMKKIVEYLQWISAENVVSAIHVDFLEAFEGFLPSFLETLESVGAILREWVDGMEELGHLEEEVAVKRNLLDKVMMEKHELEKIIDERTTILLPFVRKQWLVAATRALEVWQNDLMKLKEKFDWRAIVKYASIYRKVKDLAMEYKSSFSDSGFEDLFKNLFRTMSWVEKYRDFVKRLDRFLRGARELMNSFASWLKLFEDNMFHLMDVAMGGIYVSSEALERMYDLTKLDYAGKVSGYLGVSLRLAGDLIYDFPVKKARKIFKDVEHLLFRFSQIWEQKPKHFFLRWVANSVIVSGVVALITTAVCALAAYPYSRMRFWGRKYGILTLLLIQMFPAIMYMVALYGLLNFIGKFVPWLGLNTLGGLIFVYLGNIAFNMYLIKGFYDTIPDSLEEAAMIDGATRFQTFYKIVLPLASPILAVVIILTFMGTFNEFVLARIILQDVRNYTYALGLWTFAVGPYETQWGIFTAAALMGMTPMVILFLSLQRFLIGGLTRGAVKG